MFSVERALKGESMRVNTTQDHDRQFRDLLHGIAATPDFEATMSLILRAAQELTGASGAAFRSLVDPAVTIHVGKLSGVELDTVPDSAPGLLVYSVNSGDQRLGLLMLALESLNENDRDALNALLDTLVIAVTRANAQSGEAQAKQLARSLLDSLADPLLVFDADWRLLLMNPAAAAIFNAEAGQPLADAVQSAELAAFVQGTQPLSEWVSGEKTFIPYVQPVGADGWVLALRDMTQFKKLNRSQSEFIRIVSHDVRSPLTSMRGFADMMSMVGDLNEKQTLFIGKVLSGINQITTLVDNIQDAGRFDVETGFYEMSRSQCDLLDIAHRVVGNVSTLTQKHDVEISVSVSDDVPIISADTLMIERALTNLVDNAAKYAPEGSKVEVLVYLAAGSVIVSVRDNGYGISPEDQRQLFQRHVRLARPEHKRVKGSGLGLFIVKSVAQRHGGDAWVESQLGVGTTFSFSIPLKGANLIAPGAAESAG
jgi:signal transduction histidine kinase